MKCAGSILMLLVLTATASAYVEPQVGDVKATPRSVIPGRPNYFSVTVDDTVPWWPEGSCYAWYFVVCGVNSVEIMFLRDGTPYPSAENPYVIPLDVTKIDEACSEEDLWLEWRLYGVPWRYFDDETCLEIPEDVSRMMERTEYRHMLESGPVEADLPPGRYAIAVRVVRVVDFLGYHVELGGTYETPEWVIAPPAYGLRREGNETVETPRVLGIVNTSPARANRLRLCEWKWPEPACYG